MRRLAYRGIQCVWGFPQTLLGLLVFLRYRGAQHENFRGAILTRWPRDDGLSLGLFIFTPDSEEDRYGKLAAHEFGHTVQSLMLGPLYLPLIGLPSMVWNRCFRNYRRSKKIDYSAFYTEKWADALGAKAYENIGNIGK